MTGSPRRPATVLVAALLALTAAACGQDGDQTSVTLSPTPGGSEAPEPQAPSPAPVEEAPGADRDQGRDQGGDQGGDRRGDRGGDRGEGPPRVVETVARGLAAPWGVAFFPNGDALVTERDTARVLRVTGERRVVQEVGTLDAAAPEGEGGLLGVALAPGYPEDRAVYFYLTTAEDNRVVRARLEGGVLGTPEVLLDGIPKGFVHDGGRLAFGPDGHLYVSTGETGEESLARDPRSLAGKILRITTDGRPAPGNPGGGLVWSLGHRNVQGLAFDDQDRLWASEFGDQTWDELNLIEEGGNYGWPEVEGRDGELEGAVEPQVQWATDDNSPSGLAFVDGRLWLGALQGQRLWRVDVDGAAAADEKGFFVGDYGRIRTVVTAPDGRLWVTTSNRDGRGEPSRDDDRILLVEP